MSAIITDFAQSLLALALPILAAYLAATLKAFLAQSIASMRARASADARYLIDDAVVIAVRAAEQLGGASEQKLTYAVDLAQQYLAHHGVGLDLKVLRGLVEAAVKAEFGKPATALPLMPLHGVTVTPLATAGYVQDTAAPTGREIE